MEITDPMTIKMLEIYEAMSAGEQRAFRKYLHKLQELKILHLEMVRYASTPFRKEPEAHPKT